MSTGLAVFDTTVAESNLWLKELELELTGCDRHQAYGALRSVMHALRDRMTPEDAMRLAAQLPMLLRGVFTEGWRPAETPSGQHTKAAFLEAVAAQLPPDFPFDPELIARAVLKTLWVRMDGGAIAKSKGYFPPAIRALWPDEPLTV
jgi:uncharacterized protein (DUF2267 family)